MLRVFTGDEIADQDKEDSGDLLYALQGANTYKPLAFYVNGDGSAIDSLDVVGYDQYRKESSRTSLSTSLIDVDVTNGIYHVDGSVLYADKLSNGIYRFEFENVSEVPYKTEYFLVEEKTVSVKFDTNIVTWDTNLVTFDQSNAII